MRNDAEQELDIITHTRGKVTSNRSHTGINLFLVWGYPTMAVLLLEFAVLVLWDKNWCSWLWVGIPLVGVPLMMYYMDKDYEHTHRRTHEENTALQLWLFIGFVCGLGGFVAGFTGVYESCYCIIEGLLIGFGCFLTGVVSRFSPMKVCGIVGAVLSFGCFFLQGVLWPWQLLVTAVVVLVTLVIPGHMMRYYAKNSK